MEMDFMMPEMPVYNGMVNENWIAAAKQNSSFLNAHGMPYDHEMFKADLEATVKFAEKNVNRAVAARIIDEARRFLSPEEVNNW